MIMGTLMVGIGWVWRQRISDGRYRDKIMGLRLELDQYSLVGHSLIQIDPKEMQGPRTKQSIPGC